METAEALMIYDTTLRDGTQGEGISISAEDKLLLARKLDDFGVDYIEGGWPGSNPRDMTFFDRARELTFRNARIAAFGSTRRARLKAEDDPQLATLLEADTPVVTIFGKSWLLHVTEVLRTDPEENLCMIEDSVRFLKGADREVIYDAEHFFDGFEADEAYALRTLAAARDGGAQWLVLCDTNGGIQPERFREIVGKVVAAFPQSRIGVHCHNDAGLGVALSQIGVEAGARMVQGTINGYGERVGNANLTTLMPNLHFKLGYDFKAAANLSRLVELSHTTDKFANLLPNPKAPYVGRSAFAHKGGVHANAAQKVSRSYEHIEPEKVGNRQRILLSDMAGASSVAMKAEDAGIEVDPKSPEMRAFLKKLKEREARGYEYENADASFKVLLSQHFHGLRDNFKLVSYRTISEVVRDKHENISEAVVKIRVTGDEEIKLSVAESAGPVGALDHAMRIAFGAHFPELREVQLIDYKVRILQTGLGTDSTVQVLMLSGDEEQSWWTCGADQNIIEASWQALRDSFRYKLLIG